MTQIATIIAGPHKLFTGANGHVTFGITVKSVLTAQTWNINDYTIARTNGAVALGVTEEEWRAIQVETAVLVEKQ